MRHELVREVLDGDPLLTTAEVADLFRVGTTTVARWAHAGRLPFIRTPGGDEMRFRESVIRTALRGGPGGHEDRNDRDE